MIPALRVIGFEIQNIPGTCSSCLKYIPEVHIIKAAVSNRDISQLKLKYGEKSMVIQGNEVALISCINTLGRSLQLCEYWNILTKSKK